MHMAQKSEPLNLGHFLNVTAAQHSFSDALFALLFPTGDTLCRTHVMILVLKQSGLEFIEFQVNRMAFHDDCVRERASVRNLTPRRPLSSVLFVYQTIISGVERTGKVLNGASVMTSLR